MLYTLLKFIFKLYCTFCFWVAWPALWSNSILFNPKRENGIPLKSEYQRALKNNTILAFFGWFTVILMGILYPLALLTEKKEESILTILFSIVMIIIIPLLISRMYLKNKVKNLLLK